jgi:hypothetical protein
MNPLTQSKNTPILPVLIALVLACFALAPTARAVDPPPDGGYPNENTAEGEDALFSLTDGIQNTAVGFNALFFNIGSRNTAVGDRALLGTTTGASNTAVGSSTLGNNSTGTFNTAIGDAALLLNTTGNSNIAIGQAAGIQLTTGKNNIDIGNGGHARESAKIRIGNAAHKNTFIAGISGVTVAGGVGVIIDTDGHLGTITSSKRFKDAIKPMGDASETILALKPVTFRYKQELDPEGIPQFGLVAEEVEKVNPDLVARDADGKAYTVRYEAVNAMLLNEFLKEHRKVEQLEATVMQQQQDFQKQIQALTARFNAQESQLRRVSEQVQESKPALQLVADSQ